ncbi:MAG: HAMP domain-containing sensor histidine kinase [Elusimicrobia bacterium]|nr:HAMP domain-containing sensor histidine kinase [Elusimicrobiota bacterium]
MKKHIRALDRGDISGFSRNSYEMVFSVFMIAIAYLFRSNPQIEYPEILYLFLLLLASNFIFNRLLRARSKVNLWLLDLILLSNFWIITGVLYYSGRGDSYFWVLYLLPIFASALMASPKDSGGVTFLCSLAVILLSWPLAVEDLAGILALAVKISVFVLSSVVVHRTANSRKKAEAGLLAKRHEVEKLLKELSTKDMEIVSNASAGEVGSLVSGIMHDLGNSVSVILLSAQIAVEDEKPDKSDLEQIVKAAKFAKDVITNALSIVREQKYIFEAVDLREPLSNSVLMLDYSAKSRKVRLETDLPESMPRLRISKVHMERVFINILSNSISFAPEGGFVRVSAALENDAVAVTVADNGPGFPEKMLKEGIKAFNTTRKAEGGTGLGLFVCAQIIKKHGGTMKLDNSPAGGARITIFFPLGGPAEN